MGAGYEGELRYIQEAVCVVFFVRSDRVCYRRSIITKEDM